MDYVNRVKEASISLELIRSLVSYDPGTGIFVLRKGRAARPAGYVMKTTGYRMIRVNYLRFLAHRLAWFYVHGEWPPHEIDHINRVRDDNRIVNLRLATSAENKQHQERRRGKRLPSPPWGSALAMFDPSLQLSFGG